LPPEVQVKVIKREKEEGKKKQNNHTKPPPSDTHTHTTRYIGAGRPERDLMPRDRSVTPGQPFRPCRLFFYFIISKRGKK
jgi:hypothetical protein